MADNSTRRTLRARVAWWLRTIADRIDYVGAPKATHLSFTFEERTGIVVRDDGRGCRLWHIEDYEKAHEEAGPVASGSADVWLPHRVDSGTVLTGMRKDLRAAGDGRTVTLFRVRFGPAKDTPG